MDKEFIEGLVIGSVEILNNNKNIITLIFAGCIGLLLYFGMTPLKARDDATTGQIFKVGIRRLSLIVIFIILPFTYLYVFLITFKVTNDTIYFKQFFESTIYGFTGAWALYIALLLGTLTLKILNERILLPHISNLIRKYRVKQSSEGLSDIRKEFNNLKPLNYDPRKYFKDDYMFLGLDENGNAIYESDDDFKKRHLKFIGPTQTGKGVIQGLIIYQSILKGWITGFFDIKPDDFIYSIMVKACKEAGRPEPIVVDLNGIGPGTYNMFTNGTRREILSRLHASVNVNEKGTNADFYSANERSLMIDIEEYFDGTLSTLEKLLMGNLPNGSKKPEYYDITQKSRAYVKEMKAHKPINPKKGRGFNVDRTLDSNAVFYVRGSITDKLVKKAQTVMLMDIIQSVIRLGKQEKHFYLAIDEVKFIVSDMLSTGLSTVLSKGMNMSVAYQTPNNLLNLEDAMLNARAIKSEIEINTLTTISYRAGDQETAEWASTLTGTVNKTIIHSEEVEYDKMGAEKYTGVKKTKTDQEEYIPANRMLALPERTGALIRPGQLSQIIYTCWIPLNKEEMKDIVKPKTNNKKTENKNTNGNKNEEYSIDNFYKDAGIEATSTATENVK